MTTGVVIQARMTSKRFPGKVLKQINGRSVLERVIERAKMIPYVDMVVVAFPADDTSIPIYEECQRIGGVLCASGEEHNVLSRYLDAAELYGLDIIIRITADCPFFDPIVAGEVLTMLKAKELDYCSNVHPKRTYPKGFDVEAFTFDCLEAANKLATNYEQREHVTPWMQNTRGIKRGCLAQRIDKSHLNFCVDYQEDIGRLEHMVKLIKLPGLGLDLPDKADTEEKMKLFNNQLMELSENVVKH